MKMRQQNIHCWEVVRRIDEQVSPTRLRLNLPLVKLDCFKQSSFERRCFQDTHYGCSDSYYALGFVNLVRRFCRNREALRMHAMLGDVFRSHRQKCSRTDIQRYQCMPYLTQKFRSEIK